VYALDAVYVDVYSLDEDCRLPLASTCFACVNVLVADAVRSGLAGRKMERGGGREQERERERQRERP